MTESSALDRLDPTGRNAWGLSSHAAGPTATDRDDRIAALERENAALRRLAAELDAERLRLIRLAEAADRGYPTNQRPEREAAVNATLSCGHVIDAADDVELRDRFLCRECFDDGAGTVSRYVVAVGRP